MNQVLEPYQGPCKTGRFTAPSYILITCPHLNLTKYLTKSTICNVSLSLQSIYVRVVSSHRQQGFISRILHAHSSLNFSSSPLTKMGMDYGLLSMPESGMDFSSKPKPPMNKSRGRKCWDAVSLGQAQALVVNSQRCSQRCLEVSALVTLLCVYHLSCGCICLGRDFLDEGLGSVPEA